MLNYLGFGHSPLFHTVRVVYCCSLVLFLGATQALSQPVSAELAKRWVGEMKSSEKGPFSRILWFCKDGTTRTPKEGSCRERGGGIQHAEWSAQTKALRESGFSVATVFAALTDEQKSKFQLAPATFAPVIVERFLIRQDDGWVLRRAKFYRGAVQIEDEIEATRKLLLSFVSNEEWSKKHFLPLRESFRLLPQAGRPTLQNEIRTLSSKLADQNPRFHHIRNKIHSYPDAKDAQTIRRFVETHKLSIQDSSPYHILAGKIDESYDIEKQVPELQKVLNGIARRITDVSSREEFSTVVNSLLLTSSEEQRFVGYARLLSLLRKQFSKFPDSQSKLEALNASVSIEPLLFSLSRNIAPRISKDTRKSTLLLFGAAIDALYGIGFLSERELHSIQYSLSLLDSNEIDARRYQHEINYLSRLPSWAYARFRSHFGEAMDKLAAIEDLASLYIDERLRGSILLYAAGTLEVLSADANRVNGTISKLFGKNIGLGLRRLNPGLARGILVVKQEQLEHLTEPRLKIVLVPETTSELPPVAGILTANEGNSLSHVQLLARNLGIPNVVVSRDHVAELSSREGKGIVLAATSRGVVRISDDDPKWDELFGTSKPRDDLAIEVDLKKLNLAHREFVSLRELRTEDSGRIVGPKAAKLADLKRQFPDSVADGLALPFGIFNLILQQKVGSEKISLQEWMKREYRTIKNLDSSPEQQEVRTQQTLAAVRNYISSWEFPKGLKDRLRDAIEKEVGSAGVFVRSDTNVEDLPNFTGAGLNLTVPNVVGFENILKAIKDVWASPFSERAYSWRQAHMNAPEHVYTAVLLLKSVGVDKSGVMITSDIDTGDDTWLTIAVNEGIGGAVDNQVAETLLLNKDTGVVRLLSSSNATKRKNLNVTGGLISVPASGNERVLNEKELVILKDLSEQVANRLSVPLNEIRKSALDIEFGFVDGELALFQIRPFVQNKNAKVMEYLLQLERQETTRENVRVNLNAPPEL